MIVREESDVMQISIRKSFIFEYNSIFEYNKILYLDSDIIVTKPLEIIFKLIEEKEIGLELFKYFTAYTNDTKNKIIIPNHIGT